jgi:hypothetical protein
MDLPMQDEDISQSGSESGDFENARDDAKWQQAVLGCLLDQSPYRASRPSQLNKAELAREVLGENPGFAERDAFERAIEDLIRAGLLQHCEAMILVTRAAQHCASLELA